ncbi:FecR family protein [Novosphingobium sp. P6W]|uniref:FecR family protein n=1 Tax=Novosphingobium sp. P6W TaxID=1609758 RepID=UPI0005C2D4ED|nr:FecR domain-containing protein [Novosphingobium sp. P6W]AXB76569.1 hypothetical protein TQ38_008710 [Novosphingobium sp. P6W]KIS30815.1 hypothetical protein TQ38_20675 [Novosphingobium sp. P6W]
MTGEEWPGGHTPGAAALDAATWCARIRNGLTEAEFADLGNWFRTSDDNRAAFETSMLVAPLTPQQRDAVERALMHSFPALPGVGSISASGAAAAMSHHGTARQTDRRPERKKSGLRPAVLAAAALAATVAVVLGLGTKLVPASLAPSARAATYETGHGSIRSFTLEDGSALTLDSDSRIDVSMNSRARHARLLHGRARLSAARDRRPFTIVAASGRQIAFDGVIDIGIDEDQLVDLRLRSGNGHLKPDGKGSNGQAGAMPLSVDQQVVFPAAGATAPKVVAAPVADTRAWPSGLVDYKAIALVALVRDANRYARRPIVLDDRTMGSLTVSGRFQLTDGEKLAERLAEVFDLVVVSHHDGIHLRRR